MNFAILITLGIVLGLACLARAAWVHRASRESHRHIIQTRLKEYAERQVRP
jgi:hypothetical protein